jgi:GNAT superfamily N-acetyltransferase
MQAADYHVRPATMADADILVHHRIAMFREMGDRFDDEALGRAFRMWLEHVLPHGSYRAWLLETAAHDVVSGGGITIVPWPPGPRYRGERLAFVYNVYTEPAYRGRGLARRVMQVIHEWCRGEGITSLALNASAAGQPLYDSLGYRVTPSPMMFFALD